MSELEIDEPIIGWSYMGERADSGTTFHLLMLHEREFGIYCFGTMDAVLRRGAQDFGVSITDWLDEQRVSLVIDERFDEDRDRFPVPIYASQLACTDEWTPLAPAHHYTPFAAPVADQRCTWCGKQRPVTGQEESTS